MWNLNVDPTIFNVLSDLMGAVAVAALGFALGTAYPHMIRASMDRGNGILLDEIITPPDSLWAVLHRLLATRLKNILVVGMAIILTVSTFAHPAADFFLDFTNVAVASKTAWFLGQERMPLYLFPTYALLSDGNSTAIIDADYFPGEKPVAKLISQVDDIAQGLSRHSIVPPASLWHEGKRAYMDHEVLSGAMPFVYSPLLGDLANPVPKDPKVQCYNDISVDPTWNITENKVLEDFNFSGTTEVMEGVHVFDTTNLNITSLQSYSDIESEMYGHWLLNPNCDYETESSNHMMVSNQDNGKDEVVEEEDAWKVLSWNLFRLGQAKFCIRRPNSTQVELGLPLSWEEMQLAVQRDHWQYGRVVRNDITLVLGCEVDFGLDDEALHALTTFINNGIENGNATELLQNYPSIKDVDWDNTVSEYPNSKQVKVENSVLTGPYTDKFENEYYYLSSWSYQCPFVNASGELSVSHLLPDNNNSSVVVGSSWTTMNGDYIANASGCLIDTLLSCIMPTSEGEQDPEDSPECSIASLGVTVLKGIEVDPLMLAAYAGIAWRNGGHTESEAATNHYTRINSIAAAYVVTRDVVVGALPVEEIRPSIGPAYIFFLFLPILVAIPLCCFFLISNINDNNKSTSNNNNNNNNGKKTAQQQSSSSSLMIPRSAWDLMVLGKAKYEQSNVVPEIDLKTTSEFPSCPPSLKYGAHYYRCCIGNGGSNGSSTGAGSSKRAGQQQHCYYYYGLGEYFDAAPKNSNTVTPAPSPKISSSPTTALPPPPPPANVVPNAAAAMVASNNGNQQAQQCHANTKKNNNGMTVVVVPSGTFTTNTVIEV